MTIISLIAACLQEAEDIQGLVSGSEGFFVPYIGMVNFNYLQRQQWAEAFEEVCRVSRPVEDGLYES